MTTPGGVPKTEAPTVHKDPEPGPESQWHPEIDARFDFWCMCHIAILDTDLSFWLVPVSGNERNGGTSTMVCGKPKIGSDSALKKTNRPKNLTSV